MKKHKFKLLSFALVLFTFQSFAQQQIVDFLQGNVDDAQKLSYAYLEPLGKMFGTSLNGGWYQAASPHKVLGFDITLSTTFVTAPVSAKSFDVNSLNLSSLTVVGNNSITPTISGASSDFSPELALKEFPNDPLFKLPQGGGVIFTPMVQLQGAIGLPFHTELIGRYLPMVTIPKVGQLSMWGIGIKNEFKEFIPGLKYVPIDLSLLVGYTRFNSSFDVNYKPSPGQVPPGYTSSDFNDQEVALKASGLTARLLVGKTLPFISFYAGLGYSHATTDFGLKGNYAVGVAPTYQSVVKDPFVLDFTHSNFSGNIGFRVRLGVIAIHADYTLGEYALYTAGLGISFR